MEWIVEAETLRDLVDGLWTGGKMVVRCKDCVHYGKDCVLLFPADGYCYDGERIERREDDN